MTTTNEVKMTKREIAEAMIEGFKTGEFTIDPEVAIAHFENEIALLDKKAAKAKETAEKKRVAGDELTAAVKAALTEDFQTLQEIAAAVDYPEVTVAKVRVRANQLVKNGEAEKTELTIPGTEGTKTAKRVAFKLA